MIRRFSAAVATVAIAATVASGCSTFSSNSNAAEAGGAKLSVQDFETITDDLVEAKQFTLTDGGEIEGSNARAVLGEWISTHLLSAALADAGSPIDDATRTAAQTNVSAAVGASWAQLSPLTQQFLVEDQAATDALAKSAIITDAQAQTAYESGIVASNTLCMRFIAVTDSAKANDLFEQLTAGADFATLADANNAPGSPKGGIYSDQTTNSECAPANTLNSDAAQTLAQTPVGTPSAPLTLSSSDGSTQYFILYQRPWSEVSAAAAPLVRKAVAPAAVSPLIADAKVHLDSRYGTWDPATSSVVTAR